MDACNLTSSLASFNDLWQPRRIAAVNDHDVKIAKVQGEFVWHSHPDSDELFMVIEGELDLELRDGTVTLRPHDVYVVPKGVEHRPVAANVTSILMVELHGTVNTGDAGGSRTVEPIDLA